MCEYKERRKKSWTTVGINVGIIFLLLQVTGWAVLMYSNQNKLSNTQEKIVETLNNIHEINKIQEEELKKFSVMYNESINNIGDDIRKFKYEIEESIDKINTKIYLYHYKVEDKSNVEDG